MAWGSKDSQSAFGPINSGLSTIQTTQGRAYAFAFSLFVKPSSRERKEERFGGKCEEDWAIPVMHPNGGHLWLSGVVVALPIVDARRSFVSRVR